MMLEADSHMRELSSSSLSLNLDTKEINLKWIMNLNTIKLLKTQKGHRSTSPWPLQFLRYFIKLQVTKNNKADKFYCIKKICVPR